ncbi:MAG TPA: hypothetical protein VK427_27525 [Kofleriaceae bacterium]|nr:hypothetical protein [Kofleriaceae bacterium]
MRAAAVVLATLIRLVLRRRGPRPLPIDPGFPRAPLGAPYRGPY